MLLGAIFFRKVDFVCSNSGHGVWGKFEYSARPPGLLYSVHQGCQSCNPRKHVSSLGVAHCSWHGASLSLSLFKEPLPLSLSLFP